MFDKPEVIDESLITQHIRRRLVDDLIMSDKDKSLPDLDNSYIYEEL